MVCVAEIAVIERRTTIYRRMIAVQSRAITFRSHFSPYIVPGIRPSLPAYRAPVLRAAVGG